MGAEPEGNRRVPSPPLPHVGACYLRSMTAAPAYEVVCPHCKKTFTAELMGEDERRQGFKCPHCRLFVPYERAETEEA
jgi:DNA-directed RNA polymerase subunit RPC12/RpoP